MRHDATRGGATVNIIAWDNGSGLSADLDVLTDVIPQLGYQIRYNGRIVRRPTTWPRRIVAKAARLTRQGWGRLTGRPAYDVNLFIEAIDPSFLPHGRVNCLLPHPEWVPEPTMALIASMDWILCKAPSAVDIFARFGVPRRFISFTARDRYEAAATPKQLICLHVAGQSKWKGTDAIIEVWRRHPEWPMLYILRQRKRYGMIVETDTTPAPNITFVTDRIADETLRRYQNTFAINVATSEAEGFGHVIVEAMSCGAIVITTDAAPMNELVRPGRGMLVSVKQSEPMCPDPLSRRPRRLQEPGQSCVVHECR